MDVAGKLLLGICVFEGVLLIAQQVVHQWHVHKLLNKLMSRDFHDYHKAIKPEAPKPQAMQVDLNVPEDLRVLQGFQIP